MNTLKKEKNSENSLKNELFLAKNTYFCTSFKQQKIALNQIIFSLKKFYLNQI